MSDIYMSYILFVSIVHLMSIYNNPNFNLRRRTHNRRDRPKWISIKQYKQ